MDTMEEAGGPPQRNEALLPAADLTARGPPRGEIPSATTGQPNKQHATTPANRPLDITARESSEAPDAGRPGPGPPGLTPNAEHAAPPPPPTNCPRGTDRGSRGYRPIHGPSTPQQRRRAGGRHFPGGADIGPGPSPRLSPKPGQPHPTRPSATKIRATPSWSPARVPATQTEPRATTRSPEATIQGAHPSRCPARHTFSAITPPWGQELNTRLPRMTGARP